MSTNVIGKVLVEQFRVDAFVASGGMDAVYRVWDLKRNVPLAMKVLHAELAEIPLQALPARSRTIQEPGPFEYGSFLNLLG